MLDLTFGEQVKIVLKRKGMTIKELAEAIEAQTGKKMSRQNLTQRLGRDNFQEKDMRMIAAILGCPLRLTILEEEQAFTEEPVQREKQISEGERQEEKQLTKREEREEKQLTKREEQEEKQPPKREEQGEKQPTEGERHTEKEDPVHEKPAWSEGQPHLEKSAAGKREAPQEHKITVGEFLDIQKHTEESEQETLIRELLADMDAIEREGRERDRERELLQEQRQDKREQESEKKGGWMSHLRFRRKAEERELPEEVLEEKEEARELPEEEPAAVVQQEKGYEADSRQTERGAEASEEEDEEEDLTLGEVNPYTGREYASNSVRMHPKRIGYVQVYNRKDHKWTDMTEWAFLGYQERKKMLLGKDYVPPVYLD